MKTFLDDLKFPEPEVDKSAEMREQFAQANASIALSGFVIDQEFLDLQEKIITGELTGDEVIKHYGAQLKNKK